MTVITRPIITEKSTDAAARGKFTFEVSVNANKKVIKKEVEDKFKVHVEKVFTANVKGKVVRAGRKRTKVTKSSWKKAIVQLKPGEKIDLFEIGAA